MCVSKMKVNAWLENKLKFSAEFLLFGGRSGRNAMETNKEKRKKKRTAPRCCSRILISKLRHKKIILLEFQVRGGL